MSSCCFRGCSNLAASHNDLIVHESHHFSMYYPCSRCPRVLSSASGLDIHINNSHHARRLYRCETCETTFTDPARLSRCRNRHLGKFKCLSVGCSYTNYRRSDVVKHLKNKHPDLEAERSSIQFDRTLGTSDPPLSREDSMAATPPLDELNFLVARSEAEILRDDLNMQLQERHNLLRHPNMLNTVTNGAILMPAPGHYPPPAAITQGDIEDIWSNILGNQKVL